MIEAKPVLRYDVAFWVLGWLVDASVRCTRRRLRRLVDSYTSARSARQPLL